MDRDDHAYQIKLEYLLIIICTDTSSIQPPALLHSANIASQLSPDLRFDRKFCSKRKRWWFQRGRGVSTGLRGYFFRYATKGDTVYRPGVRSFDLDNPPCRRTKSYTIPIFPGSVCLSRLCLWKRTTNPPPPGRPSATLFRVFMKQQSVHARVHMSSKFVPSEAFAEKRGMRNGRIMRHIAGPMLPRAPTCSRTEKALSIDDWGRGGIVSTISDVRELLFLRQTGRRLALPEISSIIRFDVSISMSEK